MRFIHAADLHIDSPMSGPTRRAGSAAPLLAGATRTAFDNLVRATLDMGVELVVFAGDALDGDWRDFHSGLHVVRQLARLTDAGVRVVAATGNHDAVSAVTSLLPLPEGVHVLPADRPATLGPDELELPVAVHGRGHSPRRSGGTVDGFPRPLDGVVNVGLLHTDLARPGGRVDSPSEDDLRRLGYDYWALGHVHRRHVVSDDPWIVYPGNLQGRNANEEGPKGFTLVTVESNQIVEVAEAHADVVRWHVVEVDLTEAVLEDEVVTRVRESLAGLAVDTSGRLVAARVRLVGTTELHHRLHHDLRALDSLVRSVAAASADMWVERVEVRTDPPLGRTASHLRGHAVGALFDELERLRTDPVAAAKRFGDRLAPLRSVLPAGVTDPTSDASLARGVRDAEAHLHVLLEHVGARHRDPVEAAGSPG